MSHQDETINKHSKSRLNAIYFNRVGHTKPSDTRPSPAKLDAPNNNERKPKLCNDITFTPTVAIFDNTLRKTSSRQDSNEATCRAGHSLQRKD